MVHNLTIPSRIPKFLNTWLNIASLVSIAVGRPCKGINVQALEKLPTSKSTITRMKCICLIQIGKKGNPPPGMTRGDKERAEEGVYQSADGVGPWMWHIPNSLGLVAGCHWPYQATRIDLVVLESLCGPLCGPYGQPGGAGSEKVASAICFSMFHWMGLNVPLMREEGNTGLCCSEFHRGHGVREHPPSHSWFQNDKRL